MAVVSKILISTLLKSQIAQFLDVSPAHIYKDQLVDRLMALIETDEKELNRLLDTFPKELAVGPTELRDLLQCTPTERLRWIKEGKIPILEQRPFHIAGRDLLFPVHERRAVLAISQEQLMQWRQEHASVVEARKRKGATKASQRRKEYQAARQSFLQDWQQTVSEWVNNGSPLIAAVLQLAYWTVWISRWAKENQLKARKATKHAELYQSRMEKLYALKNAALFALIRTPYARLSFYIPEAPDKHTLYLCETHYEMMKEDYYDGIWDFFYANSSLVKSCAHCIYEHQKHFYSLYHVEVEIAAYPDMHFSFHMPYSIGKQYFPSPKHLPKAFHVEQDGLFRFGRSLLPFEKIIHREQDVLNAFKTALAELERLCSAPIRKDGLLDA